MGIHLVTSAGVSAIVCRESASSRLLSAARHLAAAAQLPFSSNGVGGTNLRVLLQGEDDLGFLPGPMPAGSWVWLRLSRDGGGELAASDLSCLYAGISFLTEGTPEVVESRLHEGLFLNATFEWNRSHFDNCLNQMYRRSRGFDESNYLRHLASSGFTHVEVNGLDAFLPMEETTSTEFYPQFYTYCPGFNHFVESRLTRGLWPAQYLSANLTRLKRTARLALDHGLKPGLLMFEPRSLPEKFFIRYPTLRGARVDHPFRSRLPRFTLAQDHPASRQHYREVMENLMKAVPELDYLSIWSNDSGAGFEHTASLYVGRNGGPYLIREWRNHEKVAAAASASILGWLTLLRDSAAGHNPDFVVTLRIEPFKVEHDYLMAGLGGSLSLESTSLLVRGYELPYEHPRYPEQKGIAGNIFHIKYDSREKPALEELRKKQVEPVMQYGLGTTFNHEPLIGLPFTGLLYTKLQSMRELGLRKISGLGGLHHVEKTPYWPIPYIVRAVQFTPDLPLEDVLEPLAREWVGQAQAKRLLEFWERFNEVITWQPATPHYSGIGFVWQRTWDRPFVPDIEAIPGEDRQYYERYAVVQPNNPAINDYGRDVLFELISPEAGRQHADYYDKEFFPRLDTLIKDAKAAAESAEEPAKAVFTDLLDRARAYRCWCMSVRNVCLWVATVNGYIGTEDSAVREACVTELQAAIDLEMESTRQLLELWESGRTEFMVVCAAGESGFVYGENFGELLHLRLELMEKYRHHTPRIDKEIMWRL